MKSKSDRLALLSVTLLLALASGAAAQNTASRPMVIRPAAHDISAPLREMAESASTVIPSGQFVIPLRATRPLPGSDAPQGVDPVLQTSPLPLIGTVPGLNFDGVPIDPSLGVAPPDPNGSVGTTQFVQTVNFRFEIFDKSTGNSLLGPAPIHTLWNGFGGACETAGDGGDPIVLFDKAAQRWVISQLSGDYTNWCMAVSTSSDATGTYNRYAFPSNGHLDDYPKLGVWPDAYYRATNTFASLSGGFLGANACAFDRATMLAGGAANEICFQQGSDVASLLPSDLDGATPPAAGEPNFFVELLDTSHLGLFKFHVDFATPANSTFTGPTAIPVASFNLACGGGNCIPQLGTTQQLDSLGDRLMYRLAYRNFGDHEALVVNHSVSAGSSGGVRWYEIRDPNGAPTVFQQGTFAPDATFRWMGSIGMDQAGDIAVGYSASSSSIHPAIRYTGRISGDPPGSLEGESSIIEGGGSQTNGLARWGDYSGMSIDPGDDCTFFYTTQYEAADGSFNWNTRIGSFKFPNCGTTAPDFFLSGPFGQTVVQGNSTTLTETVEAFNGYNGTVALSVSGCPTGATCTLNPTSSGPPNYPPSTLTVATTGSTPTGNYTVTITGTDGTNTHTTSVVLTVVAPDFSISIQPPEQSITGGTSATYTVPLTPLNSCNVGKVSLTVSGLPANSTGTFSPNPVTLACSSSNATLTVATGKGKKHRTPPGIYLLTVTATSSGGVTHSTQATLVVTAR